MKKYCLNNYAKRQLKELFDLIFGSTFSILGAVTLLFMLFMFDNTAPQFIKYWGLLGWMITLPTITIWFKRWLQENIEEC